MRLVKINGESVYIIPASSVRVKSISLLFEHLSLCRSSLRQGKKQQHVGNEKLFHLLLDISSAVLRSHYQLDCCVGTFFLPVCYQVLLRWVFFLSQ